MRRAVLAIAHGVVGEYPDRRQFHQRREPNGRARIIAEDEERGAEGAQLRYRHPVDRRGHRVLANAEVQIPAAARARLEVAGALEGQDRLVRGTEIRRAAEQPGDVLRQHVEHFPRGVAPRDAFGIGRKDGQTAIPSGRQLTALHQIDLGRKLRIFRAVGCD